RDEKGEEARAGGWGPIVDDEGSAYGIARAGLAAVLRAFDGRGQKTLITELLERDYERSAEELPRFVYGSATPADDIARYSRVVIEAAQANDSHTSRRPSQTQPHARLTRFCERVTPVTFSAQRFQ